VFYLLHRAVKKEKSESRSAGQRLLLIARQQRTFLDRGPGGQNLLPEILTIPFRFRLHHSAIVIVITQAFLQLILDRDDRELTAFVGKELFPMAKGVTARWTR